MLTADFNSDANVDLVFLQVFRITVVLGNGDGTFQAPIHTPVTANPFLSSMAVGDFNNDGKTDVVVFGTSNGTPFVQTYLGQGDGTFAPPISSPSAAYVANPAIVADVNHDGILDLIGPCVVALGAGDGTFQMVIASWQCAPGGDLGAGAFAVADFRDDGDLDLGSVSMVLGLTGYGGLGAVELGADVSVCPGAGNGTFDQCMSVYDIFSAFVYTYGSYNGSLAVTGDFNGDGRADMLAYWIYVPGYTYIAPIMTFFGNGDGTFQKGTAFGSYQSSTTAVAPKLVVADMNGDGKSDLVEIAGWLGSGVFLSNGDGTFSQAATLPAGQVSVATADFNNDGLPDIVTTTADVTTIFINTTVAVSAVVNAASLAPNQPVAPGSLVAILGQGLGPTGAGFSVGQGPLPDSIGSFSATFNGIPAPVSFVSARQINVQVPWEITGDAEVVVTANGVSTAPFKVATAAIAPGVFATASGQALAFNSDGTFAGPVGSVLGVPSHPAVAGDTLTVFADGLGPVMPSIADGAASVDAVRTAGVTPVSIGGVYCQVPFVGLSQSLVGVNQLSVVVPAGVHGIVPLQINAGGIITTRNVTVAVQ